PYPRRLASHAAGYWLTPATGPSAFLPNRPSAADFASMDEHQSLSQEEPVCAAWQRTIQAVIGVFLLAGAILAVHYHEPARTDERRTDDLRTDDLKNQVQQLTLQVDLLKQEQAMPAMVPNWRSSSLWARDSLPL